jgi:hypothetical protein
MPTTVYDVREAAKFTTGKRVDLVVVECTCGLLYAIPENLNRSALKHGGPNGWQISCPLGHTWHYTGEDDLSEQLKRASEQLVTERERLAAELAEHDQTRAHLRGERIAKTRFKNERDRLKQRGAGGVCPADGCHRHFENLERHIVSKHPELRETVVSGA